MHKGMLYTLHFSCTFIRYYDLVGRYKQHVLTSSCRIITVADPPSDTVDDGEPRILMEWSLWDDRDDEQTGRRIRVVPNGGPEGAWKAILEMQPHAHFWVEQATLGFGDSPDDFDVVEP